MEQMDMQKLEDIHIQYEENKVFYKAGWNAALDAAIKAAEKYESYGAAYEIRTLRK